LPERYRGALRGRVVEDAGFEARVLCQNIGRRVCDPLERSIVPSSEKIAVIENQEEFRAIRAETLDRMWETSGKDPKISFVHVVAKHRAIGIHYGHARIAIEHNPPLIGRMPVHLTVASCGEAHIDARDIP